MGPLIAAGSEALLAVGVILLVAGLGRRIPNAPVSRPWAVRLMARWRTMDARHRLQVVLCVGAGVVTGIWTGQLAAVVLIPLVSLGIPYLLNEPPNPGVEILAALDRWLRFLGPSIATGKSVRDAIITTRGQVPQVLATPMARVVTRLDLGWITRDALIAMADELESADTDRMLAALAVASSRSGIGARAILVALAENTQIQLRTLREIATERVKPRAVMRQIVDITLTVLVAVRWLSPDYFAPYGTPTGRFLALMLTALCVGVLLILRRRTLPKPTTRFLRGSRDGNPGTAHGGRNSDRSQRPPGHDWWSTSPHPPGRRPGPPGRDRS